jgi:hypothetical protein
MSYITKITVTILIPYKGKAVPLHAMEALGVRGGNSYSYLTSALDGGEWSASLPGRFNTISVE